MRKTNVCLPSEMSIRLNGQEDAYKYAIVTPTELTFQGICVTEEKEKARTAGFLQNENCVG